MTNEVDSDWTEEEKLADRLLMGDSVPEIAAALRKAKYEGMIEAAILARFACETPVFSSAIATLIEAEADKRYKPLKTTY